MFQPAALPTPLDVLLLDLFLKCMAKDAWSSLPVEPLTNVTRAAFVANWRGALLMIGMLPRVAERLLSRAEAMRTAWSETREKVIKWQVVAK